jgi:hypothetical protein
MDRDQARHALTETLRGIAPEADLTLVAPDAELADALDLDSMDMLELYAALAERTGVDLAAAPRGMDQAQRARRSTLDGILDALTTT